MNGTMKERKRGLAYARQWRSDHTARAATAPFPFRDHRTVKELPHA
jgi:hypothetical protein